MNETTEIKDIFEHCRVCLRNLNSCSFLDARVMFNDTITYNECFIICAQTDILADGLPYLICEECELELQLVYQFRLRVQKSTKVLLEIKNRKTTEEITLNIEAVPNNTTRMLILDEYSNIESEANGTDELESITNVDEGEFQVESLENEDEMYEDHQLEYAETSDNILNHYKADSPESLNTLKLTDEICIESVEIIETIQSLDEDDYDDNDNNAKLKGSQTKCRERAPRANGPPFKCEKCEHVSRTRALLASHRHRKHRLKENQMSCPRGCTKMFDTVKQMERHLKRKTCESYPNFECNECGKKCIGVANFEIHMRFHRKTYPYVCHICSKAFMLKTHLNDHIRTKHSMQRYICEHPYCGKLFQSAHSLRSHQFTHTQMPYECAHCKKRVATRGSLRYHIKRVHNIVATNEELIEMCVVPIVETREKLTSVQLIQT